MIFPSIMFWVWMAAQDGMLKPAPFLKCDEGQAVMYLYNASGDGPGTWLPFCVPETVNGHSVPEGCQLEHIVTAEGSSINTKVCDSPEIRRLPYDIEATKSGQRYSAPSSWAQTAEHVIEIRTKREDHGTLLFGESHCQPTDEIHPVWTECGADGCKRADLHCERVTREIWIDGVKFGVLKETEGQ